MMKIKKVEEKIINKKRNITKNKDTVKKIKKGKT